MKKLFNLVFVIGIFGFLGCGKGLPDKWACTNRNPFDDSTQLLKFAADSIKPTMDTTGVFYQIIDYGNSNKPSDTSHMIVDYVGKLMSGKIFDSATNSNLKGLKLSDLIGGWRIGLPKIGVGGHIKLLIPSAYAWGCTGYLQIPPDAPVYFDIWLRE